MCVCVCVWSSKEVDEMNAKWNRPDYRWNIEFEWLGCTAFAANVDHLDKMVFIEDLEGLRHNNPTFTWPRKKTQLRTQPAD